MMTIFYGFGSSLYVNLTNKCPCNCDFCIRHETEGVGDSYTLWLDHTPSYEEVIEQLNEINLSRFDEIVFCGYGEPTESLDVLLKTADEIKRRMPDMRIRINTNGLGNLIAGRDITPLFKGRIDAVNVSLNTPNAEKYCEIVHPRFGSESYGAMLDFTRKVKKYVPDVSMSTVSTTITHEEEEQCRAICDKLGVRYRIRIYA